MYKLSKFVLFLIMLIGLVLTVGFIDTPDPDCIDDDNIYKRPCPEKYGYSWEQICTLYSFESRQLECEETAGQQPNKTLYVPQIQKDIDPNHVHISVTVYRDYNGNNIYDWGEGMLGMLCIEPTCLRYMSTTTRQNGILLIDTHEISVFGNGAFFVNKGALQELEIKFVYEVGECWNYDQFHTWHSDTEIVIALTPCNS